MARRRNHGQGWRVVDRPAVKFLRSISARPLPEPEAGDVIERLRGFVNVANEDDFKLIVSWLVAALRPGRPFPILIVNGIQGPGKSVLCRLLRSLIDRRNADCFAGRTRHGDAGANSKFTVLAQDAGATRQSDKASPAVARAQRIHDRSTTFRNAHDCDRITSPIMKDTTWESRCEIRNASTFAGQSSS